MFKIFKAHKIDEKCYIFIFRATSQNYTYDKYRQFFHSFYFIHLESDPVARYLVEKMLGELSCF
jgi:hypothetical protein